MKDIFLLLGSNLGDRERNLALARKAIEEQCGPLLHISSIYKTAAWGKTDQPDFYNQALQISTLLEPIPLLDTVLSIERTLGRVRAGKWGERIIDIDILFYDQEVVNTENLSIPHPGIPQRRFVLTPLAEIAPHFHHPVLQKEIATLLLECCDPLPVHTI